MLETTEYKKEEWYLTTELDINELEDETIELELTSEMWWEKLTGTDSEGNEYQQWEMDAFADEEVGICAICGAELYSGWRLLDDGTEFCDDHFTY